MTTRILASELSPFSARLRLACAFKKLALPFEPAPGGSGSAELKKIHPFGRIPVLLAGDAVLVESLALLEYLEDANPGAPSLRPADPVRAARARMIALLFDHNVIKALQGVFAQLMKPQPDPAAARTALDDVTTELGKLVYFFDAEGPGAVGAISIADCAMAPFAFLIDALSSPFGATSPTQRVPRFKQWWTAVARLPEVVDVTSRMHKALVAMMAARKAQAAA